MLKQFGSASVFFMAIVVSALMAVTPAAAQVSRYHNDFKPSEFNPASPGLQMPDPQGWTGPNNFAMPGFGWDESHGEAGRPGVYFPNVVTDCVSPGVPCLPEDPTNRAFVFLYGAVNQTSSTFTSTTTPGNTFPVGGIDPTLPDNAGLGFSWSQHLENTANGNPIHVRFAVQTASAGNPWYVSNGVFDTGTVGQGSQGNYDPQVLTYNTAKANWLNLTIPPGGTPAAPTAVVIGAQPAANLSGNIIGIGFVAAFVNASNSTVHIDFVDVGIPPVPGDVTGDRMVKIDDYNIIKGNFGTNQPGRAQGDLTGDGVVNLLDFSQWKNNFVPPPPGAGSGSGGAVPEPASAVLMALALPLGWGVLRFRKKNTPRRLA